MRMKSRQHCRLWVLLLALAALGPLAGAQVPIGTTISYQGELWREGVPLNGSADLAFRLFSTDLGGVPILPTLFLDGVAINEGRFTAYLDFGAEAFSQDAARWLEIQVRYPAGGGGGGYTTLQPRQRITAAPVALHALSGVATSIAAGQYTSAVQFTNAGNTFSGSGAGLVGLSASSLASGTIPSARLSGVYSGELMLENPANSFAGSGAGLTALNAGNVSTGTLNDARLSANVALRTRPNTFNHPTTFTETATFNFGATFQGLGTGFNSGAWFYSNVQLLGRVAVGNSIVNNPAALFVTSEALTPIQSQTASDGGGSRAILGWATSASGNNSRGVYGRSEAPNGYGVYGLAPSTATSSTPRGVVGEAPTGSLRFGVYAIGNLGASGTKPFCIDHPDDPEGKYLLHYAAESPEVINFYRGTVRLDSAGEAVVELPAYFGKINRNPSYMLTAIGGAMPGLHIAVEISEEALAAGALAGPDELAPLCTFRIAGGMPHGKVSWRIEAERNDLWMREQGAAVEVEKPAGHRGTYQAPSLYGKGPEHGLTYEAQVPGGEPVEEEVQGR
jgi:hypothetical protein